MMSMNNAWVVGWFKYFLNNSDFKNFFGRVYNLDSSNDVTSADQLKHRLWRNNKAWWLIGILPGFAHVPLGWVINTQMCHAYFQVNKFRLQANIKMWRYGTNSNNNDLLNLHLRKV